MYCLSLLETNRLLYSRSFRGIRASDDNQLRRMMSTIVELSPEQGQLCSVDVDSDREEQLTSLSPLAQGESI